MDSTLSIMAFSLVVLASALSYLFPSTYVEGLLFPLAVIVLRLLLDFLLLDPHRENPIGETAAVV